MQLITEATMDEEVSVQLGKLQTVIQKLEKMADKFEAEKIRPIRSQNTALIYATADLEKLRNRFGALLK